MSQPRIEVQHWLLARTVRAYGASITESDLLGVAFEYAVPPDTEFPSRRGPVVAFLRVTARSAGVVEFLAQVHHERRPGVWQPVNRFADRGRPLVLPVGRTVVLSESIRLPHVRLEGTGVYAVTIYFRPDGPDDPPPGADPTPWDPDEPGWVFGAVDYFRVVKS